MTTSYHQNLVDWLRDAHAMEEQAEKLLEGQAKRLGEYPDLKAHIEQHLVHTREQQRLLNNCIQRLGSGTSVIKDLTGKIMGIGQTLVGIPMTDEVVKGAMGLYVFAHIGISSYTVLVAAAEAVGDEETQRVCERILLEEFEMANWLLDNLPMLTRAFMARSATPGSHGN